MAQRLAQHLISRGLLPAKVVDDALRRLQAGAATLDTALLEMGAISEAGMLQALSDVSGMRLVNLADFEPNAEAGPMLPLKISRRLTVVPLSVDGKMLHLAVGYPVPHKELREVAFLLGKELELWVALECRIRDWQTALYREPMPDRFKVLLRDLDPGRRGLTPAAGTPLAALRSEARPGSSAAITRPSGKQKPELVPLEDQEMMTESISVDVLEKIARGVVDEPVLLVKPKVKRSIPGAPPDYQSTVVVEPLAYAAYAQPSQPMPSQATDEVLETTVLDTTGYANFARQMSSATEPKSKLRVPGDRTPTEPEMPAVVLPPPAVAPIKLPPRPPPLHSNEPPTGKLPRITAQKGEEAWRAQDKSFPGGVLPPRSRTEEPQAPKEARPVERSWVMPAAPARPSSPDRVRSEAKSPKPGETPPPPAARDEADFSDVQPAPSGPRAPVGAPASPSSRALVTSAPSAASVPPLSPRASATSAPSAGSPAASAPPLSPRASAASAPSAGSPAASAPPLSPRASAASAPSAGSPAASAPPLSPRSAGTPAASAPPLSPRSAGASSASRAATFSDSAATVVSPPHAPPPSPPTSGPLLTAAPPQRAGAALPFDAPGSPSTPALSVPPELKPSHGARPEIAAQAPNAPPELAGATAATFAQARPSIPSYAPRVMPGPSPAVGVPTGSPADWTLAQARGALKVSSQDRDKLVAATLDYGRRAFEFVGAFAVMRGAALGWEARGEGDTSVIRQISIPLDAASVFRTVALTRGSYVGPLPPDALTQHYLSLLGRSPRAVFLWPVEVKARLVAMIYGDSGGKPVSQRRLNDFILFCQELPAAFGELIVFRKQRLGTSAAFGEGTEEVAPVAPLAPITEAEFAQADAEWFDGLLTLLTGPDPRERANAMTELSRTPDSSARALARAFPGPTAWSRLPVTELPEVDELGPIPGALARLGRPGAVALAPLLDSDESDTRYLALLTAGALKYPELLDGVLRGLFDMEPDISSAARAAATAMKWVEGFEDAVRALRQELASRDPLRKSLAARALGMLHDREAIEGLIGLTASEDQLCSQSAAEALREISRANLGPNPRQWAAWYAMARDKRRVEWLCDALENEDFDLRLAAVEELSRAWGDNLGFLADGEPAERQAAVERWRAAVASRFDFDL
jgi:HEAT repeat protein